MTKEFFPKTTLAIVTAALTLLCAYQMYYYTLGCLSMGEKYMTLRYLF